MLWLGIEDVGGPPNFVQALLSLLVHHLNSECRLGFRFRFRFAGCSLPTSASFTSQSAFCPSEGDEFLPLEAGSLPEPSVCCTAWNSCRVMTPSRFTSAAAKLGGIAAGGGGAVGVAGRVQETCPDAGCE